MPSIWSKITEYYTWFLWGKRPYSQLNDVEKQEARRDLYFRLFCIANAPFFIALFATFQLSITPATALKEILDKRITGWREGLNGRISFGVYVILQAASFSAANYFFVCPCYTFAFNKLHSLYYFVKLGYVP